MCQSTFLAKPRQMFNVYNTHRGHFQITHFTGTVEIEFTNKDYSYAPLKVDNELIKSYFPFSYPTWIHAFGK